MTPQEIFDSWGADIPLNAKQEMMGNYPEAQNIELHPVIWETIGTTFKASIRGMLGSTAWMIFNSDGEPLENHRMMAQMYIPVRLKNCIKALHPEWSGEGIYSSPVVSVWRVLQANTEEQWDITFDDPALNKESIAAMNAYLLPIVSVDKYGKLI